MTRVTLGSFSLDTERDAELIALFEKAKAEGRPQSDMFREMGRIYLAKENVNETILSCMSSIIESLEEIKIRLYSSGIVVAQEQSPPNKNGLSKKARGRLRNLGTIEEAEK